MTHRLPNNPTPLTEATMIDLVITAAPGLRRAWEHRSDDDSFLILGDLNLCDIQRACLSIWGESAVGQCFAESAVRGGRPMMPFAVSLDSLDDIARDIDPGVAAELREDAKLIPSGLVPLLVKVPGDGVLTTRWTVPGATPEAN